MLIEEFQMVSRKMTTVALYSEQPILTAGLQAAIAGLGDMILSAVFTDLDSLADHVRTSHPSVALVEVTAAVTFSTLSKLKSTAADPPIVLWVDAASVELVSQALELGVRGILRKSLPVELQIKCLRAVAAGDLWVEQAPCDRILTSKRVVLTQRERQVMSLIAQGLKNKEIAYALTLTESTVKVYLSRLFDKVGVHDRFELALLALKHLYVNPVRELQPAGGEIRPQARPVAASSLPHFVSVARPAARVA
jgi:DNA-binding NarL/FixJ family response regulator